MKHDWFIYWAMGIIFICGFLTGYTPPRHNVLTTDECSEVVELIQRDGFTIFDKEWREVDVIYFEARGGYQHTTK